jgi:putative two-component system response regulator
MIDALSAIIEYRSLETGQHINRIGLFTRTLLEDVAKNCPEYLLSERVISLISSASSLHDIGKIAIPDAILNKPGKLTPENTSA